VGIRHVILTFGHASSMQFFKFLIIRLMGLGMYLIQVLIFYWWYNANKKEKKNRFWSMCNTLP
jgi:hypothetical protein